MNISIPTLRRQAQIRRGTRRIAMTLLVSCLVYLLGDATLAGWIYRGHGAAAYFFVQLALQAGLFLLFRARVIRAY